MKVYLDWRRIQGHSRSGAVVRCLETIQYTYKTFGGRLQCRPPANLSIESIQELLEALKRQGAKAEDIFYQYWVEKSAEIAGKYLTVKLSLCEAFRDKLNKAPYMT